MKTLQGQGVSPGIAFGQLCFYKQTVSDQLERRPIKDAAAELQLLDSAIEKVGKELDSLFEKTKEELDAEAADVFLTHKMMLEDPDFQESIKEKITKEHICAASAVAETQKEFSELFAACEDQYMQERAADIKDISYQLIRALNGAEEENLTFGDVPVILAAEDLSPSETAKLDLANVKAFVTVKGAATSHTAIFARTMGLPAVVALTQLTEAYNGRFIAVDGAAGTVYCEPDEKELEALSKKQHRLQQERAKDERYRGRGTQTKSGHKIKLYANAGGPEEIKSAVKNDAEGIGLLRSEFLYLQSSTYPTEENLYQAYRGAAERMQGKQVIIRTLDIGADKQADYFELEKEENPAMGLRAIRLCLKRPEILKTQLRAIYRASAYGKLAIMFPMIISLGELRAAKKLAASVRKELREAQIPFAEEVPVGIMIETPAAALLSDALAKECDFFSVGTNDLTQYTLALDRQNEAVSCFDDPQHEAVLRLIQIAAANAHAAGIWIGICGELGADQKLLPKFVRMGIDELSVTASNILPLRAAIAELE